MPGGTSQEKPEHQGWNSNCEAREELQQGTSMSSAELATALTTTVLEQLPRSLHKGATSMHTHPVVK